MSSSHPRRRGCLCNRSNRSNRRTCAIRRFSCHCKRITKFTNSVGPQNSVGRAILRSFKILLLYLSSSEDLQCCFPDCGWFFHCLNKQIGQIVKKASSGEGRNGSLGLILPRITWMAGTGQERTLASPTPRSAITGRQPSIHRDRPCVQEIRSAIFPQEFC